MSEQPQTEFEEGDIVKPTAEALRHFRSLTAATRAVVVQFSRNGIGMTLQRDGLRPQQWACHWWMLAEDHPHKKDTRS